MTNRPAQPGKSENKAATADLPPVTLRPIPEIPPGYKFPLSLADLPPYRRAVIQFALATSPRRFIEVGSHLCETSVAVLRALPTCEVLSIDWHQPAPERSAYAATGDKFARQSSDFCEEAVWHARLALRAVDEFRSALLKVDAVKAATYQPDNSADAVFLDASYDGQSIFNHLVAWWPKVRRGGVLFGREWDASQPRPRTSPSWDRSGARAAVDGFCKPTLTVITPRSEQRRAAWSQSADGNTFWAIAKGGQAREARGWELSWSERRRVEAAKGR